MNGDNVITFVVLAEDTNHGIQISIGEHHKHFVYCPDQIVDVFTIIAQTANDCYDHAEHILHAIGFELGCYTIHTHDSEEYYGCPVHQRKCDGECMDGGITLGTKEPGPELIFALEPEVLMFSHNTDRWFLLPNFMISFARSGNSNLDTVG